MKALPLSPMSGDPSEAVRALLALTQQQWEQARDEADKKRRAAVQAALASGISASEVARAMGLTHTRVAQIARGTR